MIFNTPWFLAFFCAFYLLLLLLPGRRLRFVYLLGMSAVFHTHYAGPAGVAPIIAMAVAVYFIAIKMADSQGPARKRLYIAGLFAPVFGLIFYKYRVFLLGGLASYWPALGQSSPMPLAISFFTFEFVHYLTDVYKGNEPIRKPLDFGLFTIYFPSIVSGPIKRYEDFSKQVKEGLRHPFEAGLVGEGFAQLMTGFFKKMVIADNATLLIGAMEKREGWGPGQVAVLMLLLSVRILFDFSGYSDIAIGLSKMIGLRLPANFNFPYIALNPSDFWRRWHMSLSSWIRDYIYIPLGGSRQGAARRVANSLFAMALCGLWHGPAWNFVVWGIYHGAGLAAHAGYRKLVPAPENPSWWGRGAAMAATFAFVSYGWILFFYPLERVAFYTRALFGA